MSDEENMLRPENLGYDVWVESRDIIKAAFDEWYGRDADHEQFAVAILARLAQANILTEKIEE